MHGERIVVDCRLRVEKNEANKMGFQIISEQGQADYEIWTCDTCGHQITLQGVGGDVAECPECINREYQNELED